MTRIGRSRLGTMLAGGAVQVAVWIIVRPDRAGAHWTDGTALETWLAPRRPGPQEGARLIVARARG
jgi:hypothetical protein